MSDSVFRSMAVEALDMLSIAAATISERRLVVAMEIAFSDYQRRETIEQRKAENDERQ